MHALTILRLRILFCFRRWPQQVRWWYLSAVLSLVILGCCEHNFFRWLVYCLDPVFQMGQLLLGMLVKLHQLAFYHHPRQWRPETPVAFCLVVMRFAISFLSLLVSSVGAPGAFTSASSGYTVCDNLGCFTESTCSGGSKRCHHRSMLLSYGSHRCPQHGS